MERGNTRRAVGTEVIKVTLAYFQRDLVLISSSLEDMEAKYHGFFRFEYLTPSPDQAPQLFMYFKVSILKMAPCPVQTVIQIGSINAV